MGATKKVLWALVLVATVDLIVGKQMAGGASAGPDLARMEQKPSVSDMAGHRERSLASAARSDVLPAKAFAQKR